MAKFVKPITAGAELLSGFELATELSFARPLSSGAEIKHRDAIRFSENRPDLNSAQAVL
jgi:hypothetical protein